MEKKIIKIENHYLTIKHYKEPLKAIPKGQGFGYYGCLLVTTDGTLAQCHICGKLFKEVSAHARQAHKITTKDYRLKFKLSPMTALISEEMREERKQRTLEWLKTLSKAEKARFRVASWKGRRKRGQYQPKITLETRNKRGNCPDQLIAKIHEVANKIGHTPSLSQFIDETGGQRYKHLIFTTFGSWLNALKIAKLTPKIKVNRGGPRIYTREELKEYLSVFAQEHRRLPTATDCKRGLLPDYPCFIRAFGSIETARQEAGVYNFID